LAPLHNGLAISRNLVQNSRVKFDPPYLFVFP